MTNQANRDCLRHAADLRNQPPQISEVELRHVTGGFDHTTYISEAIRAYQLSEQAIEMVRRGDGVRPLHKGGVEDCTLEAVQAHPAREPVCKKLYVAWLRSNNSLP